MRLPSYLHQNEYGIYYFRACFSKHIRLHLNKIEFKKSLGTRNKKNAVKYSRAIKLKFDELCYGAILNMDWLATKTILNEVVDRIIGGFNDDIMEYGTYGRHITNYPELMVENEADQFIAQKMQHIDVSMDSFPLLREYTDNIIKECQLDNDPKKIDRNITQVAEMLLKLRGKRLKLLENLYLSAPFLFERYKKQIQNNGVEVVDTDGLVTNCNLNDIAVGNDPKVTVNSGITLRQLIDKFVEYKTSKNYWGSPDTIKLNIQKLNYVYDFFKFIKNDSNLYLSNFKCSDAEKFETYFQILPKNRTKKYPNVSIENLVQKSLLGAIPANERISAATYNSYVDLLAGLFNYAVQPKQNYIDNNYFIDLKVQIKGSVKRYPFDNYDLQLFFSTDLYKNKDFNEKYSWRYWIPIIMAYEGFRLEEAAQLLVKNVFQVDGIYCFDIVDETNKSTGELVTKLKNESSRRTIPIHPKILEIGFLKFVEYVSAKNEEKIFYDLSNASKNGVYKKAGAKVSRWFNEDDHAHYKSSYLTNCGVNKEGKPRKVLYSFRHTVQSLLNNHPDNIENDKIDHLFGHSIKSIGRKVYGGYSPETILEIVKLIDYPNANLPWYNKGL